MADQHNYSFFGQKVGLIVQSSSKNEPFIFFRVIKSKENGSWEKPSKGEGKVIKFSLEEMVWIIRVLRKEVQSWFSFHNYKDKKTKISFKWQEGEKGKLWVHIGSYSKILDYSQFKILELLLNHIINEKIEFATIPQPFSKPNSNILKKTVIREEVISINVNNTFKEKPEVNKNTNISGNEVSGKKQMINGFVRSETDKALLIRFDNDSEIWIPKSTIHSNFTNEKNINQNFTIDTWILEKNKVSRIG